jgi:23S rRNA (uracil1939-C5)-methyltransferase
MNKIIEHLEITDIADQGRGVGRHEGRVVFVKHVVPGDVVNVSIKRKKNKFIEALVESFVSKSDDRVLSKCEHFGVCGGCKWQNMHYEKQLFYKEKQVRNALTRIAGIVNPDIKSIRESTHIYAYRNRLDFAFSSKEWMTQEQISDENYVAKPSLGFHVPGKFDKVLNIESCHLQANLTNLIRNFIRDFALENGLSFFDRINQTGLLRNLIIRNTSLNEWMVIVMFKDDDTEKRMLLLSAISNRFPEITSLIYIVNTKGNDTFFDLPFEVYKGAAYITEEMEGLKFKIGPKSFYQTNPEQAFELYRIVRQLADLTNDELVYDLYTGTGTIAQFLARNCKRVIGIESVEEAITHAKENASMNLINNVEFFAGDMKEMMTYSFFEEHGFPAVIITDPPRSGMHPEVVKTINSSGAKRVVYVSCNVATQARDLMLMNQHYRFKQAIPVDMFPHTDHVENVVLLEKIN